MSQPRTGSRNASDRQRRPSARRRARRGRASSGHHQSYFGALVVVLLIVAVTVASLAFIRTRAVAKPPEVEWGVTFSQKASRDFAVDWRANYLAIVHELKPSGLRLVAYWDLVEPAPGRYDFRDLDWQFDEAEKAGIPVILAVGQKVPRWPEYHFPKWLDSGDKNERQKRLLVYLSRLAEHYRDRRLLVYWQVENEPFVPYGKGPALDVAFLKSEIATVRKTDPRHEILETDGGEWGRWYPSADMGDAFGTTLYRRVYSPTVGSFSPSRTPEYYQMMTRTTKGIVGRPDEKFICVELQAEPWGSDLNHRMTIAQQEAFFPEEAFAENVDFARKTGLKTFYFWGAEWWYYLKVRGHPAYWERAKAVIGEG